MDSDRELLRQYAIEGNESAFTEVVRRHTDFVYSAALRLVAGDAHLAQDVAQSVFTTLARKAATLAHRDNLLGWLHTSTRYAASVAVRGERRRRTHEQESLAMNDDPATLEMNWAQLQPLLDEAVGRLRVQDREAVLLRFFQGKSHREVGAALGLNEALTRKRVERALEKMRAFLSRRGVKTSTAMLATAITTNSVQAAPAGLAMTLGGASLAQAAKLGLAAGLWHGFMTTKTKSTLAAAALLLIAAVPITVSSIQASSLDAQNAELAGKNASLEESLAQITADLKSASSGQTLENAVAKTPGGGADYVPVPLNVIRNKVFNVVNANTFTLNDQGAALLGLTPDEARQVQNVIDDLHARISAYEHTNLRKVDPTDLPKGYLDGPFTQQVLGKNPGNLSAYQIRQMTDDELSALQQWFLDSMTKAVGADRAQIILDKSMDKFPNMTTNASDALWLKPGVQRVIVISDFVDAKGVPRSSWISGSGGTTNSRDLYPDNWADLLKDARANVRPPDPTATPQKVAVLKNLRNIFECGKIYMEIHGVKEVSYSQLINSTDPKLKPPSPVAGENYEALVVHQGDSSLTLNVPGQGPVTYEP